MELDEDIVIKTEPEDLAPPGGDSPTRWIVNEQVLKLEDDFTEVVTGGIEGK